MITSEPVTKRLDRTFRWPNGARVGIIFNVAYEDWSDGQTPGIGPMGNPLKAGFFDANAASWGLYGPVRGIWRALEIAGRHNIPMSVMTNGVLAEKWPDTVRAIHDAGHEVVAHSYGMDVIPVYLDERGQRENISRTTGLIADSYGRCTERLDQSPRHRQSDSRQTSCGGRLPASRRLQRR